MNHLHKIMTSRNRNRASRAATFLLLGVAVVSMATVQEIPGNDTPAPILRLSLAGLYIDPIESLMEPNIKDPDPCVPCDGEDLSSLNLRIDIGDTLPVWGDWELQGIFFAIGGEIYWFDRSTDSDVLNQYSAAGFEAVIVEDFYGLVDTETEQQLAMVYEFLHRGDTRWLKRKIGFK